MEGDESGQLACRRAATLRAKRLTIKPERVEREPYASLVRTMTAALAGQYAVVGNDLVVENGAVVDLGPNPVVSFDRIIIHGTGQIKVHDKQKVSAGSVQYLPSYRPSGNLLETGSLLERE